MKLVLRKYERFNYSPVWKYWNGKGSSFGFALHWSYLGLRAEDEYETIEFQLSFFPDIYI